MEFCGKCTDINTQAAGDLVALNRLDTNSSKSHCQVMGHEQTGLEGVCRRQTWFQLIIVHLRTFAFCKYFTPGKINIACDGLYCLAKSSDYLPCGWYSIPPKYLYPHPQTNPSSVQTKNNESLIKLFQINRQYQISVWTLCWRKCSDPVCFILLYLMPKIDHLHYCFCQEIPQALVWFQQRIYEKTEQISSFDPYSCPQSLCKLKQAIFYDILSKLWKSTETIPRTGTSSLEVKR